MSRSILHQEISYKKFFKWYLLLGIAVNIPYIFYMFYQEKNCVGECGWGIGFAVTLLPLTIIGWPYLLFWFIFGIIAFFSTGHITL